MFISCGKYAEEYIESRINDEVGKRKEKKRKEITCNLGILKSGFWIKR